MTKVMSLRKCWSTVEIVVLDPKISLASYELGLLELILIDMHRNENLTTQVCYISNCQYAFINSTHHVSL